MGLLVLIFSPAGPLAVEALGAIWASGGTTILTAAAGLGGIGPIAAALGFATEGGGAAGETGAGADPVVLGHAPEYLQVGEKLGAQTFNIPGDVWQAMTPDEQWAANQSFLDQRISNGSNFLLATPADAAREGSFYERQLEYLESRGYTVSPDGTRLVPPSGR